LNNVIFVISQLIRASSKLLPYTNETTARRTEDEVPDVSPRCADLPDVADRLALLTIIDTRCSPLRNLTVLFTAALLCCFSLSLLPLAY
jgi:hypothetical protein